MPDEWISIEDALPEYDMQVKVRSKTHESVGHLSETWWRGHIYWCTYTSLIKDSEVTHWRPLKKN